jgi:hypothetical protein
VDDEEFRARIEHAKKMTRSLRNHAKDVSAYLTDFEEWLDTQTDPPAQEAQGHGTDNARVLTD